MTSEPSQQLHQNRSTPPTAFSISSRQPMNHKSPGSMNYSPSPFTRLESKDRLLHNPRKTHPIVWCCAIICLVFCLLLIIFGVTTLIIFLVIKPQYPSFDIANASLNAIYFDSPGKFNSDFSLLANFTNTNRKIRLRYDYLDISLYFGDKLIATQALEPFSQNPREGRLEVIRLISSLVYLAPNAAIELQRQVQGNRVKYNVKGNFRIRAITGVATVSYLLHAYCQLQITSPPNGILVARNCIINRK